VGGELLAEPAEADQGGLGQRGRLAGERRFDLAVDPGIEAAAPAVLEMLGDLGGGVLICVAVEVTLEELADLTAGEGPVDNGASAPGTQWDEARCGEPGADAVAGAMEAARDRADGHAERVGGDLVAEPLDIDELDDVTEPGREAGHRVLDGGVERLAGDDRFGAGLGILAFVQARAGVGLRRSEGRRRRTRLAWALRRIVRSNARG
jgi:hypothetical protein